MEENLKKWFCVSDYCHVVPNSPGCYAIFIFNIETLKKKLIYVGTAKNLKIRLAKHEIVKVLNALIEMPEIPYIMCKVIIDDSERKSTESRLIARLNPKANYINYGKKIY